GSDGNLYTWGNNGNGQLGRDTGTTPADRPGRVTPPTGITFTQTSAGSSHSVAVGSDGNLYTWGDNSYGQLGRDTGTTPADRPGRVTPPTGITFTQTSAGQYYSMAVGSDGNLYTWGRNENGQLGRDTGTTPADRPGRVTPPTGITFTQTSAGSSHSVAVGSDGNLYTWGNNGNGQLGRDTGTTPADRPGRVTPPTGITFTQASAGGWHSMAIGSNGNLYTWGYNGYGQLGRDGTLGTPGPVLTDADVTFTQTNAGYWHSMAVGSDGNLYTWGSGSNGKLGRDTSSTPANRPGRVVFPSRGTPTRVLFDRLQSTVPTAGADDTWTVTTPAHTAGGVPVTISWTLDGTPQADDTGNTYRYVTIGSLPLTGSHGILLLAAIGLTLMTATDAARRHRHPTHTSHE
ncbi:RCC1 domain-containing protein, partial [Bifidobacterium indicum]|uniref:RCC1 domain-containing protein n=1 Tax=Bifidobacterium indicum TaxID=1691 RepID=UPI003BB74773